MLTIKELIERASETMDESAYHDYLNNTIKTCGYNSDTFSLLTNLDGSVPIQKYKDSIVKSVNTCSKEKGIENTVISELPNNMEDLTYATKDEVSKEELDGILFDANIEMVDDYCQYMKLNGVTMESNVDSFLEKFSSGVDRIENSLDYEGIKNDLHMDLGITTIGLENLAADTSFFDVSDDYEVSQDEPSVDIDLEK